MTTSLRLVVALSGNNTNIGLKLLMALNFLGVETHLIIDKDNLTAPDSARIEEKTRELKIISHLNSNLTAPIASGSYQFGGMIVVSCSKQRLRLLAQGYSNDLIGRVADVVLKENRVLVLSISEELLLEEDLRNLLILSKAGVKIVPLLPIFYDFLMDMDQSLNQIIGRIMDRFGLEHNLYKPWDPRSVKNNK